jgi:hypothetical protein
MGDVLRIGGLEAELGRGLEVRLEMRRDIAYLIKFIVLPPYLGLK